VKSPPYNPATPREEAIVLLIPLGIAVKWNGAVKGVVLTRVEPSGAVAFWEASM
jgi:hypothetical protein